MTHSNRKMTRVTLGAVSLAVIAAAISAAPAAAASKKGDASGDSNEVVVTAQFRSQKLQDTPIAITAVNSAMLEARSQTSLSNVADQAPNVNLKETGGAFGPGMTASIRGVGQADFDPAFEPGVGMYIDDVYYASLTGSNFDLIDLDRVEIARGPQGTLSGRNSIGGSIKLYSKKPSAETDGFLQVGYGSYNHIDVRGAANLTIVPDQLFARISGVSTTERGYVKRIDYGCAFPSSGIPSNNTVGTNCQVGTEGGHTYSGGRIALRWLSGDKLEVNLAADYTRDTSEVAGATLLYANRPLVDLNVQVNGVRYDSKFIPTDPYVSYASFTDTYGGRTYSFNPATLTTNWGFSGVIDYKLADTLSVHSITGYRNFDSRWVEDNDVSPDQVSLGAEHLFHHQWSEELRLNGSFANKMIEYTLGGYYFDQTTTYPTHQILNYAGPFGLEFYGNDPVTANSKAVFLHAAWHATSRLNLTGGLRYTTEEKTYNYSRLAADGVSPAPLIGTVNGHSASYSGHHWDYRVNLDYHITDDVMAYVQTATGFKGGGTNPRPFFGPGANFGSGGCADPACQLQPFKPETLTAYEIGFKTAFLDHKVIFNASGFYNKYKSIQLTLLNCPQFSPVGFGFLCALPINAGNADIKGLEFETTIHPTRAFTIDASYSYIHFNYTSLVPGTGVSLTDRQPGLPNYKWSIGAQYEIDFNGKGTLTPRIDVNGQGDIVGNAINSGGGLGSGANPGYTLINARLTWRSPDKSWEVSGSVINLGNKLYYNSIFDLSQSAGFIYGIPAKPRAFEIQLKRNF